MKSVQIGLYKLKATMKRLEYYSEFNNYMLCVYSCMHSIYWCTNHTLELYYINHCVINYINNILIKTLKMLKEIEILNTWFTLTLCMFSIIELYSHTHIQTLYCFKKKSVSTKFSCERWSRLERTYYSLF